MPPASKNRNRPNASRPLGSHNRQYHQQPAQPMDHNQQSKLAPRQEVFVKNFWLGSFVSFSNTDESHCTFYVHFDSRSFSITPNMSCNFFHARGKLSLSFGTNDHAKVHHRYQLRCQYNDFKAIKYYYIADNSYVLILLKDPLRLFGREPNSKKAEMVRTTKIAEFNQQTNFGKCTALLLQLDKPRKVNGYMPRQNEIPVVALAPLMVALKLFLASYAIKPELLDDSYIPKIVTVAPDKSFKWDKIAENEAGNKVRLNLCCVFPNLIRPDMKELPFTIQYALHCVYNYSYQFEDELEEMGAKEKFWTVIRATSRDEFKCRAAELGLFDAFNSMDRSDVYEVDGDDWDGAVQRFIKSYKKHYKTFVETNALDEQELAKGVQLVRRAVLTPTRFIVMPPFPYLESRIFRDCELEYALRVTIRDDNGQQISFGCCMSGTLKCQEQFLEDVVVQPVRRGLHVGLRRFEYLGSSNSQIRDHGIIVYAMDSEKRTAQMMRESVGDLVRIRSVPKYMSRLGLAFSQAMNYITIPDEAAKIIEDVERGSNPENNDEPYNFTDGVGLISISRAREICEKMRIQGILPSAYQIRYKGYKGLLVLGPEVPEGEVQFRRSMVKFESTSNSLEILKYSRPRQVYLNRPLIALLDDLGVETNYINELLFRTLRGLISAFLDDQQAAYVIHSQSSLLIDIIPVMHLLNNGVSLLNEPFFRRVLNGLVQRTVKELKEKARIPVDFDKGRIVFGCADDYCCLREDEIFLQVSYLDGRPPKVISGKVMITKYPCMHPGDVRMVTAVDNEQVRAKLGHMVDCVVFSTEGNRPLPDKMAGSDLDGDEYSVIWDEKLFFKCENHAPMTFPCYKAADLDREITTQDMLNFLVQYIIHENVGKIAIQHLARADYYSVSDRLCQKLCRQYSIALDFVKTGYPAILKDDDRTHVYPDFMMKFEEKPTCHSVKTLGQVYRNICQFELSLSDDDVPDQLQISRNPKEQFLYHNWENFTKQAHEHYLMYAREVESAMHKFNIDDESYLMANILMSTSKHASSRKDITDIQEIVEQVIGEMFRKHRRLFLGGLGSSDPQNNEQLLAKASAYYQVAETLNQTRTKENQRAFYSFPWLASKELGTIAALNRQQHQAQKFKSRSDIAQEALQTIFPNVPTADQGRTQVQQFLLEWLDQQRNYRDSVHQLAMKEELLKKMRLVYERQAPDQQLSPPAVVLKTFDLLIEEFYMPTGTVNKKMRAEIYSIALSAISTLSRFYRTLDPTELKRAVEARDGDRKFIRTFHIVRKIRKDFDELVLNELPWFENYLCKVTKCTNIGSLACDDNKFPYLLVCAQGTSWQLLHLQEFITRRNFFRRTMKHHQKEKEQHGHRESA